MFILSCRIVKFLFYFQIVDSKTHKNNFLPLFESFPIGVYSTGLFDLGDLSPLDFKSDSAILIDFIFFIEFLLPAMRGKNQVFLITRYILSQTN